MPVNIKIIIIEWNKLVIIPKNNSDHNVLLIIA